MRRPSASTGSMRSAAIARRLCDPLRIGRVIARPFLGSDAASFRRTGNRRDFAMPPPPGTVLDRAAEAGRAIVTVGKTADIFAHRITGDGAERRRQRRQPRPSDRRAARAPGRRPGLRQSRRFRYRAMAIAATRPAMRPASSASTGACRNSSARCGPATSSSSPPTTATTRPSAAPTTRANSCRSWPMRRADRPERSGARRASPTWAPAWPGISASPRQPAVAPGSDARALRKAPPSPPRGEGLRRRSPHLPRASRPGKQAATRRSSSAAPTRPRS